MIDLDEDPFLITSWTDYCNLCIEHNRLDLFKKKLCEYIRITNRPIKQDLQAYTNRRMGEIAKEKLGVE